MLHVHYYLPIIIRISAFDYITFVIPMFSSKIFVKKWANLIETVEWQGLYTCVNELV